MSDKLAKLDDTVAELEAYFAEVDSLEDVDRDVVRSLVTNLNEAYFDWAGEEDVDEGWLVEVE